MIYHQTFLKVSILAGSSSGSGYVNSVGTFAKFNNPLGIAINEGGNILIADYLNNVIRRIDTSRVVTTLAGSTQGYADGPGTYAQFIAPSALTVGLRDYIYVVDNFSKRLRLIEGYATPTITPSKPNATPRAKPKATSKATPKAKPKQR